MKTKIENKILTQETENQIDSPPIVDEFKEKPEEERDDKLETSQDFVPTIDDIEKWQGGYDNYNNFCQDITKEGLDPDEIFSNLRKREIQAVFLGEKPVTESSEIDFSLYREGLLKYGLIGTKNPEFPNDEHPYEESYVINIEKLNDLFWEKKEFFKENGYESTGEIIKGLEKDQLANNNPMLYGVILGYPEKAAQEFIEFRQTKASTLTKKITTDLYLTNSDARTLYDFFYQEPGITLEQATESLKSLQHKFDLSDEDIEVMTKKEIPMLLNKKFVDAEGIQWVEYSHNPESELYQQRLKAAFSSIEQPQES